MSIKARLVCVMNQDELDRPSVEGTPTVVVHDIKGDTPVTGGAIVVRP